MASRWSDLDRPPLSQPRLARSVLGDVWSEVRVVESTSSTNADVGAAMSQGHRGGLVVIAEEQTSGRGRLARQWIAPPRSSLLLSAGLRPSPPDATWPLLPLLTGSAVVEAVQSVGKVAARLKWPNDVIVIDPDGEARKLGGILLERVDSAVVIGIGLNVSLHSNELPVPNATSISLENGVIDRQSLAAEILRCLERHYDRWSRLDGDASSTLPHYRTLCATIGSPVRLDLPGGDTIIGLATDVDDEGRVVVDTGAGAPTAWSAGDVTHLRSAD